jgi:GDP-L-fucose synthase
MFLDDFVKIMLQLSADDKRDIVNIGAGEEFSIRQFAERICNKVGYDFRAVQFDTARYVGARSKCLETRKLRTLIPDLTLTPLEAGLTQTIEWYRNYLLPSGR